MSASLYWPGIFQWFQAEKRGRNGAKSDLVVRCSLEANIVHEGHEETRRKVKKQARWQSLRFIPDFMHAQVKRDLGADIIVERKLNTRHGDWLRRCAVPQARLENRRKMSDVPFAVATGRKDWLNKKQTACV